jgi:hypothetical protein
MDLSLHVPVPSPKMVLPTTGINRFTLASRLARLDSYYTPLSLAEIDQKLADLYHECERRMQRLVKHAAEAREHIAALLAKDSSPETLRAVESIRRTIFYVHRNDMPDITFLAQIKKADLNLLPFYIKWNEMRHNNELTFYEHEAANSTLVSPLYEKHPTCNCIINLDKLHRRAYQRRNYREASVGELSAKSLL